jgi:predicted nucleic acid-binding protein
MLIVADTGPLISLAIIDRIDLLDVLFYRMVIPQAVWQELEDNIKKATIPQVRRFQNNVMPVTHYEEISTLLGSGETEAILLYQGSRAGVHHGAS